MKLFKYVLFVPICSVLCAGVVTKEVASQAVHPLAKVIEILKKIQSQVVKEGYAEGSIYKDFACFCKEKTNRLETMVKHHADKVDSTSANIGDWTAQTKKLRSEHEKRLTNHEEFSTELVEFEQRLKEENSRWQTVSAQFDSNKRLIDQALKALKDSKNRVSSSAFVQIPGIAEYVAIADSMGLMTAKEREAATSLLQGKKRDNPLESYGYHGGSNDIIDLVQTLMKQMQTLRDSQQDEHVKAAASFREMIQVLKTKIAENQEQIRQNKRSDAKLVVSTAQERKLLSENKEDLEETDQVLKEVSSACEARAKEYDARASMREDELSSLTTAMACLGNARTAAEKQARALLQAKLDAKSLPNASLPAKPLAKSLRNNTAIKSKDDGKVVTKPLSFLQEPRQKGNKESFLARADLSSDERKKKALDVLLAEGQRIKSVMLTTLVTKLEDDPFAKVKELILNLRWRLEKEASQETKKEVWCDEELAKARHERDTRFLEAKRLNTELRSLEAKMDELKGSIKYHANKAIEIGKTVGEARKDFSELSQEELEALREQKEARDEIQEALRILKTFYSQAAKAAQRAMLQVFGTPTVAQEYRKERKQIRSENERRQEADEKRQEEQRERVRKRIGDLEGNVPAMARQGSLSDAVGLLETVESDFQRQINWVEGNLDKEQQQLVRTQQALQSQFEKAEELRDLDTQDLESTKVKHAAKFADLKTAMGLEDDVLKELEELKPACIDTGMSYRDRVAAREKEMEALKKAVCILGETEEKEKYGCK